MQCNRNFCWHTNGIFASSEGLGTAEVQTDAHLDAAEVNSFYNQLMLDAQPPAEQEEQSEYMGYADRVEHGK